MIDTKLLRQKILDLAIRGKLVPQNPDDEPASVLLEKIRQEKAALVKVGKIKKDKHESFIFRGEDKHYYEQIDGKTIDITDEIPFDIPETWEWCRLAPLLHYLSTGPFGSALHKRDYVQGGIPLINPMHIDMEKAIITPSDNARISPETVERLSAYKLSIGDIVIARRGEMGRAAIITEKEQGWLCGTGSFFLHFSSLFFNDYFINFIHTPYSKKQLGGTAVGTTMCNLNHKILSDLLIPIPPLTEQKRIVSQIEVLFAEVDEIDKDSADLESALSLAKQKVLDLAIRGKLVPQNPEDEPASELLKRIKAEKEALVKAGKIKRDRHESYIFRGDDNRYYQNIANSTEDITNEIPFPIPEKWAWTTLGFIIEVERGGSPRPIEDYLTDDPTGVNWIKIGDVSPGSKYIEHTREKIKPAGLSKTRFVHEGDFLLSNSMSFGRPYILKISGCIHDGWLVLHLNPAVIKQDFLFWILSSNTVYSWLANKASGSTVKNLKSDSVRLIYFPLPPLAEQRRIAEVAEQYMSILESVG